jgi:hypothetical protein
MQPSSAGQTPSYEYISEPFNPLEIRRASNFDKSDAAEVGKMATFGYYTLVGPQNSGNYGGPYVWGFIQGLEGKLLRIRICTEMPHAISVYNRPEDLVATTDGCSQYSQ